MTLKQIKEDKRVYEVERIYGEDFKYEVSLEDGYQFDDGSSVMQYDTVKEMAYDLTHNVVEVEIEDDAVEEVKAEETEEVEVDDSMMKLTLIEEIKTIDENGVSFKQEKYEIGNYKVTVDYEDGKLDDIYTSRNWNMDYVPEISLKGIAGFSVEKGIRFEIQTTAYGTKEVEEIQKVIKGYQEAVEVVEILTKKFL